VCRKFDDKNEMDNEGDDKKGLNKYDNANDEVFDLK
jgi:hypothetical protein